MQSQKRSTKQKQAKPQLPWGMGSATIKGKVFWLTFRDAKGRVQYENSGTSDANEARRLLAMRALPRAVASVVLLEAIANEPETQRDSGEGDQRPRSGSVAAVGTAPAAAARKAGSKGKRGGQA